MPAPQARERSIAPWMRIAHSRDASSELHTKADRPAPRRHITSATSIPMGIKHAWVSGRVGPCVCVVLGLGAGTGGWVGAGMGTGARVGVGVGTGVRVGAGMGARVGAGTGACVGAGTGAWVSVG